MKRGGVAGHHRGHAEVHQLADAVLDVEPQPAERLHQRFDVEGLVGPRAQVAQDAGAQRRLHQRAEPRIEVAPVQRRSRVAAVLARRALKVRSSIVAVRLSAGRRIRRQGWQRRAPVVVGLIPFDQGLHPDGVALAVAVAGDRVGAAAGFDAARRTGAGRCRSSPTRCAPCGSSLPAGRSTAACTARRSSA